MTANFALLIFDVWLLGGVMILLHRLSPRYGLTPLCFAIATLVALVRFASPISVYFTLTPGVNLTLAGNVFVPVILSAVLMVYIANGTNPARMIIYSIIGVEVLSVILVLLLALHVALPGGTNRAGLLPDSMFFRPEPRTMLASGLAFVIDLYLIAILYQAIVNQFPRVPRGVAIGVTLFATLVVNSLTFWTIAAANMAELVAFLPGNLIGSLISAALLWLPLGYYLTRIAPRLPGFSVVENRPTLDLLFGSYGQLEAALVRSEIALRDLTEVYRQLTDNSSEVFWTSDPTHEHFYYLSPAFESIWGRPRELFYENARALLETIHPEDRPNFLAALPRRVQGTYDEQFRIVRPDGEVRWIHARAFPIHDQRGGVYRVVGIATDITGHKRLEEHRTQLLATQEKVTLLQDFISNASHDLKSPLASIQLKVDLLERTQDLDQRQRYMRELRVQVMHLSHMIDDLLTLSRLESHSGVWAFAPLNVNEVVQTVADSLSARISAGRLTLTLDLDARMPYVNADHSDLRRAITNLIDNAIQYTPEGGSVYVQTAQSDDEVVITISDTGIGIAPQELPLLFKRFHRTFQAQAVNEHGTGLGLSIVKQIVENHGGAIEVESVVSAGTTFRVRLPRTREPG